MRLTKFSTKWDSKMTHKNETHKNFTKMRLIYTMYDPRNISQKLTLTNDKNDPQRIQK